MDRRQVGLIWFYERVATASNPASERQGHASFWIERKLAECQFIKVSAQSAASEIGDEGGSTRPFRYLPTRMILSPLRQKRNHIRRAFP